jgi:hypothetical protein
MHFKKAFHFNRIFQLKENKKPMEQEGNHQHQ